MLQYEDEENYCNSLTQELRFKVYVKSAIGHVVELQFLHDFQ